MHCLSKLIVMICFVGYLSTSNAYLFGNPNLKYRICCGQMGGMNYCDSISGRMICNNGYTSSCYCTRHAIMDLQLIEGCCMWHGGVLIIDEPGIIVCADGSVSEECTKLQ